MTLPKHKTINRFRLRHYKKSVSGPKAVTAER
jgi:hypothetical protein